MLPFISQLTISSKPAHTPILQGLLETIQANTGIEEALAVNVLLITVVLVSVLVRVGLTWASIKFAQGCGHDIGKKVFQTTLYQPYIYHTSRNSSELVAAVAKIDSIVNGMITPAIDAFTAAIISSAILIGLMIVDWRTATFTSTIFVVIYSSISVFSKRGMIKNSRTVSKSASLRVQAIQEGIGGIRDIIIDNSQAYHVRRYITFDTNLRRAQTKNNLWGQTPRYILEAVGVGVIAAIAIAAAGRDGGIATALPVIAVMALGAQKLLPLFQRIYSGWNQVVGNQGNLEDIDKLINQQIIPSRKPNGDQQELLFKTDLQLIDIGFRFDSELPWVFRNINIEIKKGDRVGFIGKTGCGKSTLLDIIMGLLPVCEGQIRIDGRVLDERNLQAWRAKIAHVPQSIFIADASLIENIALGIPQKQVDMRRLREAAKMALVDEFASSLPEGYDTVLGERGSRLSGGQKQRIGIARALYRHVDVLILDEATSALDSETEAKIMKMLSALPDKLTVLLITHRIETLTFCNKIVDMNAVSKSLQAVKH